MTQYAEVMSDSRYKKYLNHGFVGLIGIMRK